MTLPYSPHTDTPAPEAAHRRRVIRWYYAAAVTLLIVAAFLRFYDLGGPALVHDEYLAAVNSLDDFSAVLTNVRHRDSAPIIRPLALWVIQKVETSAFSVRAMAATASVLTVAVILFALPGVGVDRRTAFIAALLATVSLGAIEYARYAREYSVDALLAAALLAGLLGYLRDRRKLLLGAALFLAPLLQYGVAIFGVVVLATAAIAPRSNQSPLPPPPPRLINSGADNSSSLLTRLRYWLKGRKDLAGPALALLVGSAVTWLLTLRYHWTAEGWGSPNYLGRYYIKWDAGWVEALTFVPSRVWDLLAYQLSPLVAVLFIAAFGIVLGQAGRQRRFHPLLVLFLIAIGSSVALVLLSWYPLGDIRQNLYLGPIIFLTAGLSFVWIVDGLAVFARRRWLGPALLAGLGLLTVLAGGGAIREHSSIYERNDYLAAYFSALESRMQPGDAVLFSSGYRWRVRFYLRGNPVDHYHFWVCQTDTVAGCRRETVNLALSQVPEASRIWLLPLSRRHRSKSGLVNGVLKAWEEEGVVERVALTENQDASRWDAYLMTDTGWLKERRAAAQEKYRELTAGEPLLRSYLDLYMAEDTLYLLKEPCSAEELSDASITGRWTVDIVPIREEDFLAEERPWGHKSYYFLFRERGVILGSKCMATVPLPDYPIAEIKALRFLRGEGIVWERSIDFRPDYYRPIQAAVTAGEPTAPGYFDLYLQDDALYYRRESCTAADTGGGYFLNLVPVRVEDLPEIDRERGYQQLHFAFAKQGAVFDGQCFAVVPLPAHDYPLAEIQTGQYVGDGGPVWESSIDLKVDYYRAAYREIVDGEPAARGVFDLYLKGDTLYYYKAACTEADRAGRFFLHFIPVVAADLPLERRAYGVGNEDFDFAEYGTVFDGKCIAAAPLPEYPVAAIRSGQFILGAEQLWGAEIYLGLVRHYRAAYPLVTANPPAAREAFDLYLEADRLHYVRESCSAGDTAARFLLHFVPVEVDDLPAERREYGSENRDFDFGERGTVFDGKCMATVGLPDYPITAIRTGQFVIGEPPVWMVELAVGESEG